MSADAKVWFVADEDRGYGMWHGVADPIHVQERTSLEGILSALESAVDGYIYWYPVIDADWPGSLVGYRVPRIAKDVM